MRYQDKLTLIEILKSFTNRQLIKDYRSAVENLNYVTSHRNTGSDWHLGEPMHVVYNDAKVSLRLIINEFASRDYKIESVKNIPAIIEAKTLNQIAADKKAKETAWADQKIAEQKAADKKAMQPGIDAINLFGTFQLNYRNDFIEVAFAGGLVNHLKSKFTSVYNTYGSKAAIIMFWAFLDFENRNKLAQYIIKLNLK